MCVLSPEDAWVGPDLFRRVTGPDLERVWLGLGHRSIITTKLCLQTTLQMDTNYYSKLFNAPAYLDLPEQLQKDNTKLSQED